MLGVVVVHFGPAPVPDAGLGNLYGVSHGRAFVLFALLAGVEWRCSSAPLARAAISCSQAADPPD